ncbi:DUF4349 domain-containing protein [Paenisporosarcina sp. OV554]|uniref:DUF4349 domain-containing protein n=1 Tax=Paenisporosarcina sp. OV554 TaxID=2135694 RepID=UPI000D365D6E|nr:DUF4349 domain-containing protein [Paenisporosarcina sp. OV554]PUB13387.1 uncharacterized protein DUF4349 [Paenisporosarcina sp. OV554]
MRKAIYIFLITTLLLVLAACSSSDDKAEMSSDESKQSSNDFSGDMDGKVESEAATEESSETKTEAPVVASDRMIIHQASLSVNVKELDKAQSNIEKKVDQYGGYIVESNVYQEDDQTSSGRMIVRIPEKNFEKFLLDAEGVAAEVLERNVTGQDVTEQYVDLESRVKSKRAVEERLLDFMSKAQKTEDLLKISADLSEVQEEIEVMVGKMKYLENQTSFSTIELSMYENRVVVPEIESKELNTWEKTKKQLATSTNSLLSAGSALIVFFVGNLPVLLLLGAIGFIVFWIIKRRLGHEPKK